MEKKQMTEDDKKLKEIEKRQLEEQVNQLAIGHVTLQREEKELEKKLTEVRGKLMASENLGMAVTRRLIGVESELGEYK